MATELPRWRGEGTRDPGIPFHRWIGSLGRVLEGFWGLMGAAAMWRTKAAPGQAAAKASRTRDAISMTRAPSFNSRSRMVVKSAVSATEVPVDDPPPFSFSRWSASGYRAHRKTGNDFCPDSGKIVAEFPPHWIVF
jgi:hypothetical protein